MKPENLLHILSLMPDYANVMYCRSCDVYWAHMNAPDASSTQCWNCGKLGLIIARAIGSGDLPFS